MVTLKARDPLSATLRDAVGDTLDAFISAHALDLDGLDGELRDLTGLAAAFTAGGKRLRPAFCCWGWAAATGSTEVPDAVLRAAASLDLLHVSALVHDDVMDRRPPTSNSPGRTPPPGAAGTRTTSEGAGPSSSATCC